MGKISAHAVRIGVAPLFICMIVLATPLVGHTAAPAVHATPEEELAIRGFTEDVRPTPDKVAESFPWQAAFGTCTLLFDKTEHWNGFFRDPVSMMPVFIPDVTYDKAKKQPELKHCLRHGPVIFV